MMKPFTNQIHAASTITSSSNTAAQLNRRKTGPINISLITNVGAAPTGTSPTLQYFLAVSADGTNFTRISNASTASINSQTLGNIPSFVVSAPYWRIEWAIGGSATPTFTLVDTFVFVS